MYTERNAQGLQQISCYTLDIIIGSVVPLPSRPAALGVFNNSLWGSIQQEILPRRHFFGSGNQIFVDSFIATEDGSRNASIV